jgi:hypothetical protein
MTIFRGQSEAGSAASEFVDSADNIELALRRLHTQYKELKVRAFPPSHSAPRTRFCVSECSLLPWWLQREMELRHKLQREALASMHSIIV